MLYFNFKNYEEFKAQFGKRIGNNGNLIRSNGILLSFLKHEFKCKRFYNLNISSIDRMVYHITQFIDGSGASYPLATGLIVYHPEISIDDRKGVCDDCDSRSIRYVRNDNGRVFKMKAGKFFRKILDYNGITEKYCEQAIIYVCEKFAEDWRTMVESNYNKDLQLHVDDNFSKIYDSSCCKGSFNSCMTNRGQEGFYECSVDAKAAYLTDREGLIVARCIIFTDVYEVGHDEVYRLAERQYATNEDNVLKRLLVDKLIEGGHIDGYKQVGVDCHNAKAFVLNDGTEFRKNLYINCTLDNGDTISYQDSFKHFDYDAQKAYNNGNYGSFDLAVTESTFNQGREWDEYNECYCDEVTTINVWNGCGFYREMSIDIDRVSNFYFCERYDDYYDEARRSSYHDDNIPLDEAEWSVYLKDYIWNDVAIYCDEMDSYLPEEDYDFYLEQWKSENWEWDDVNEELVEETTLCHVWSSRRNEYLEKYAEVSYVENNFIEYEGEWYDEVNNEGIPYHLIEELEEAVA